MDDNALESADYADVAAELYDALRGEDPLPGEYAFYARELARIEGPHLEIGCGTGRILLRLLQAGIDVEGLDCSQDMLRICREKARDADLAPTLHHQSMEAMCLPRRYGAIFVPLATIMLLKDHYELASALRAFHRHLRPAGRVFFSIYLRPPLLASSLWRTLGGLAARGGQVRVSHALEVEPTGAAVAERFKFERSEDGEVLGVHRICLRFWSAADMTAFLAEGGYDDIQVTADHTGAAPSCSSRVLVFHARRA